MSFKTIVEAIVAFFKAIFGGKSAVQSVKIDKSKCMSESVIKFLVQGHSDEEQAKIRDYIKKQEAAGIYEYSFSTSRWYFEVKNGQFKSSNNPEDLKKNKI